MILGISGKKRSGKDLTAKIIKYLNYVKHFDLDDYSFDDYKNDIDDYKTGQFETVRFADKLKDIICLMIGCTREQLEDEEFKNTELGEEWWIKKELSFINEGFIMASAEQSNMTIEQYVTHKGYTEVTKQNDNFRSFIDYEIFKPTYRWLLQTIGTDLFRNQLHPNIHVNMTMKDYTINDIEQRQSMGNVIDYTQCFPKWVMPDVRFPNEVKAVEGKGGLVVRVNRKPKYICNYCTKETNETQYNHNRVCTCGKGKYETTESNHESEIALDNHKFKYTIDNNGSIEDLIKQVKEILIKEKII